MNFPLVLYLLIRTFAASNINDEQESIYHQRLQWCWQNDSIIYCETPRKSIAVGGKNADTEIYYSELFDNLLSYVR